MFASRLSPSLSAGILQTHTKKTRKRKGENRTLRTQINIFIAAVLRFVDVDRFSLYNLNEKTNPHTPTHSHKTVIETRKDVRCTSKRKNHKHTFPTVIVFGEGEMEKVTQYHRRETGTDRSSIVDSQSNEVIIIIQQALFGKTSCCCC